MTIENENVQEVPAGPPRALLYTVYIMGVVLVLLFLGVVAGLIWKAKSRANVPPLSQAVDLGLSQSQVRQMVFDGGRLALTTDSELVVIDISSRSVVLRTPIRP
jgi:hypothetical protein